MTPKFICYCWVNFLLHTEIFFFFFELMQLSFNSCHVNKSCFPQQSHHLFILKIATAAAALQLFGQKCRMIMTQFLKYPPYLWRIKTLTGNPLEYWTETQQQEICGGLNTLHVQNRTVGWDNIRSYDESHSCVARTVLYDQTPAMWTNSKHSTLPSGLGL